MTRIYCAAVGCKYLNDRKNACTKKSIHLQWNYVHTVYDGAQEFNRCKDYEMDEEYREASEKLQEMMKL